LSLPNYQQPAPRREDDVDEDGSRRQWRKKLRKNKQLSRWFFQMLRPDDGGTSANVLSTPDGTRHHHRHQQPPGIVAESQQPADVSAFASLPESPEPKYDPTSGDVAPVWHLMALLGPNFDQGFMSIQKPIDAYNFPNGSFDPDRWFNLVDDLSGRGRQRRIPVPSDATMPDFIK
jgi:hypothetical protein